MGKTKSLLINKNDKELRSKDKEQMPVLYSLAMWVLNRVRDTRH